MRNTLAVMLIGIAAMTGCTCGTIEPNAVGVHVKKFGDEAGIDPTPVGVGWYFYGPGNSVHEFPTTVQNYTWTGPEAFMFTSADGMSVKLDMAVMYRIPPDQVPFIFRKYQKDLEEITHIVLRNEVRSALTEEGGKFTVEALFGEGRQKLREIVQTRVQDRLMNSTTTSHADGTGTTTRVAMIELQELTFTGEISVPESMRTALNDKVAAIQQAQRLENEVRQAQASAQKKIAEAQGLSQSILIEAEGQAKANRILSESLTAELIEAKRVEKWNGVLPQVTTGAGGILMNLNAK